MGGSASHSPRKKKSPIQPSPTTAPKSSPPSLPGRQRRFKKPEAGSKPEPEPKADDQPTDKEVALDDPAATKEAEKPAEKAVEKAAKVVDQEVVIDVVEPLPAVDEREAVAGEEVAAAVAKELAEAEEEEEVAEAIAKIVAAILEKAVAEATVMVEAKAAKASKVRLVYPNLAPSPNPSPRLNPSPNPNATRAD